MTTTTTPATSPTMTDQTWDHAQVLMAQAIPGYEDRPHQSAMARAIERDYFGQPDPQDGPRAMFGHGPTGSGKSYAYLIPAIQAQGRTIVSVTTKALQDQLCADLPRLLSILGSNKSWAMLKGQSNYLCTGRLETALAEAREAGDAEAVQALQDASEWLRRTPSTHGLRESLPAGIQHLWGRVCYDKDLCGGAKDECGGVCYAKVARTRALDAEIVIVNHALVLTDIQIGHAVIGPYRWLILDEAHEFADIARDHLAQKITSGSLEYLASRARTLLMHDAGDQDTLDAVDKAVAAVEAAVPGFFASIPTPRDKQRTQRIYASDLTRIFDAAEPLMDALDNLRALNKRITVQNRTEVQHLKERRKLTAQFSTIEGFLAQLLTADISEYVRWSEVRIGKRREQIVTVTVCPVDVSGLLNDLLFSRIPVLMVSATLAVNGKFDYQARELGVKDYAQVVVGSSFDYAGQTLLYVPQGFDNPGSQAWESQAVSMMANLVQAARGRTLILFTAIAHMRRAYEVLSQTSAYPVKMQGGGETNQALRDWFLADPDTVLLATKSFMTGFDPRGITCQQVIITKMPFPVPDEPVFQARTELVERSGRNGFAHLSMPIMSVSLQQAVGRLMRHSTDYGVVAILDPRMVTKGYGRQIIADLPDMPLTRDFSQVEDFLSVVRTIEDTPAAP